MYKRQVLYGNPVCLSLGVPPGPGYGRRRAPVVRLAGGRAAPHGHGQLDHCLLYTSSGSFWFKVDFLLEALPKIENDNVQGEYYLPDTVKVAVRDGRRVRAYCSPNRDIVLGANDRKGLLKLGEIARMRVLDTLMEQGVDIVCADGVLISPDATVGPDTAIYPGVIIKGKTSIGKGCTITGGSLIDSSVIGDGTLINSSQIYSSRVGDGARIGPVSYTHLSLFCMWGIRLVSAYILAFPCGLGIYGIWCGMATDLGMRGVLNLLRFRSGKWYRDVG